MGLTTHNSRMVLCNDISNFLFVSSLVGKAITRDTQSGASAQCALHQRFFSFKPHPSISS